ncbi:hypothetical protein ACF0H5_006930 [Mactra antiquata]
MSRNKHLHYEMRISNHYDDDDDMEWESNKAVLFSCVSEMMVSKLRRLLDRGVKPNFKNSYQQTPLHVAISLEPCDESFEIIRLLIAFGCPIDAQDRFGQAAIHIACQQLEPCYIPILLEGGCSVNIQDNAGCTPLMQACGSSSEQMLIFVQYLLDWGASVNIRDTSGKNALYYLIAQSSLSDTVIRSEVIYKLLYAGIDVNYRYYRDETFAHCLLVESSRILTLYENLQCHFRPLLCGGCQILENKSCYNNLIKKFESLHGTHVLDHTLEYLIDVFSPVCSVKTLRGLKHRLAEVDFLRDRPALRKLTMQASTVKSLKDICRINIRRKLNNKLFVNVEYLDLPKELSEYIKYSECKPPLIGR